MKKLIRIRKPRVRVTSKGLKISAPSARIGGKAGINVSKSGVSGSVQTGHGSISTRRAKWGKTKKSQREGSVAASAHGCLWYIVRIVGILLILFLLLMCVVNVFGAPLPPYLV